MMRLPTLLICLFAGLATPAQEPAPTQEPTPAQAPAPTQEPAPTQQPAPAQAPAPAQQPVAAPVRHAAVTLDDGREFKGRVLAMDLETLELDVGDKILRIPATRIRSCQFQVEAGSEQPATELPEAAPQQSAEAGQSAGQESAADQPSAAADPSRAAAASGRQPRLPWRGALPDPIDVPAWGPILWQDRIVMLDRAYPWLGPAEPTQWISLGLLLLVGSVLMVHMSVNIAGAEAAQFGRSVGLGLWLLVTGLGQVAMVPVNDLTVAVMLLVNTTLSLLALRALFGLTRGGALVALLVQLGFGVVVYGILELVTSLLGSCGVTT